MSTSRNAATALLLCAVILVSVALASAHQQCIFGCKKVDSKYGGCKTCNKGFSKPKDGCCFCDKPKFGLIFHNIFSNHYDPCSSECVQCPKGTYTKYNCWFGNNQCKECPEGSTTPGKKGGESMYDCKCVADGWICDRDLPPCAANDHCCMEHYARATARKEQQDLRVGGQDDNDLRLGGSPYELNRRRALLAAPSTFLDMADAASGSRSLLNAKPKCKEIDRYCCPVPCPEGYWCKDGNYYPCPSGNTCGEGASSASDCKPRNYFSYGNSGCLGH